MRVIEPPQIIYGLNFFQGGKVEVAEIVDKSESCMVGSINTAEDVAAQKPQKALLFSPNEALKAFCADFLSQEKITAWAIARLHPAGAFCPECKNKITDKTTLNNFHALRRCRCKSCKKWFSALNGTALHHAGLGVVEIFIIAVFSEMKVDIKTIADILKCHPDTVKLWQAKFKAVAE